jgi:hypothetical protein
MNYLLRRSPWAPPLLPLAILAIAAAVANSSAAPPDAARITQLANDVKLLPSHTSAKAAAVNESVPEGAVLRTGADSRVELTFADGMLARVAPNSTFRFAEARAFEVGAGAVLVHAPKGSGTMRIETDDVSISTTGATLAVETLKTDKHDDAADHTTTTHYRVSVLDGEVALHSSRRAGDAVTVTARHAAITSSDATAAKIVKFDVAEWMQRNPLLTDFRPLPAALLALIGTPASSGTFAALFRKGGVDADTLGASGFGTINPTNLSGGGGNEVSPSEQRMTICHSAQTLTLPRDAAERHLRNHGDDSAGACR